jgi:hypothetical protein
MLAAVIPPEIAGPAVILPEVSICKKLGEAGIRGRVSVYKLEMLGGGDNLTPLGVAGVLGLMITLPISKLAGVVFNPDCVCVQMKVPAA